MAAAFSHESWKYVTCTNVALLLRFQIAWFLGFQVPMLPGARHDQEGIEEIQNVLDVFLEIFVENVVKLVWPIANLNNTEIDRWKMDFLMNEIVLYDEIVTLCN